MRSITYETSETQVETVSAFLMMVLEYCTEIGLFQLLEQVVKINMKAVVYSLLHKAQTVIVSLVMGCAHTKAINERLADEMVAAHYLGMARFPDQSQINRYLTRFDAANVAQLGEVHAQVFMQESRARRAAGMIVVDIDQCGLVANGKSYEFARKGYFPRKRGQQGYQLSAAFVGAYDEALQLYLDPGNTSCRNRLPDLLRDIDRLLATDNPGVHVIRRLDAGYDGADERRLLADLPGYFILKSRQPDLAARLAPAIPLHHWLPVTDGVHGVELPAQDGVRRLLYELVLSDGSLEYSLLYTNLPLAQFGVIRCFHFYNERQLIEAFFRQSRHVFNIQNLRSRQFHAIYAFLRFVFLTHNVIHWAKQARFAHTELATASTADLVVHVARVRAQVRRDVQGWHLSIARSTRWAALLLDALSPRVFQLELPFACLHKT